MKLIFNSSFLLIAALAICACNNNCCSNHFYTEGLKQAENPSSNMVYNKLTTLSANNHDLSWKKINDTPYVLMVTWKADTGYYTKSIDSATKLYKYNTGTHQLFVTASPYLKKKNFGDLDDSALTLRLDQLLGLPPVAHYGYFLQIWAKLKDIERPCFNPSTDTTACEFTPSAKDISRKDYMYWMYQYIYNSYADTNVMARYPFTHLGYTYDWCPKNESHVGLSEFVINQNAEVYIEKKIYTTRGYFE